MNKVYGEYFKTGAPARATVEVARLPRDVKIEISAIVRPPLTACATTGGPHERTTPPDRGRAGHIPHRHCGRRRIRLSRALDFQAPRLPAHAGLRHRRRHAGPAAGRLRQRQRPDLGRRAARAAHARRGLLDRRAEHVHPQAREDLHEHRHGRLHAQAGARCVRYRKPQEGRRLWQRLQQPAGPAQAGGAGLWRGCRRAGLLGQYLLGHVPCHPGHRLAAWRRGGHHQPRARRRRHAAEDRAGPLRHRGLAHCACPWATTRRPPPT